MLYRQIQADTEPSRQVYLRPPTTIQIDQFLQEQARQPFSYAAVGATQSSAPAGYVVDHNQIELGGGEQVYQQACTALQRWEMFNLSWLQLCWPEAPLTEGTTVGIAAQAFGVHILNACRIVYTVNEKAKESWRFGFAYGTLPGHIERGEERFLLTWDRQTDRVWYEILAFSQPAHWLARVGYPVARAFQRRFAHDSKAAMGRSIYAIW